MNFKFPSQIVTSEDAGLAMRNLEGRLSNVSANKNEETGRLLGDAVIFANQELYEQLGLTGLVKLYHEVLGAVPVFVVILASEPHDSILQELSSWFRANLHPNSLLQVSVRRSIGGGIVIRSKNRIFDFSLRPKLLAAKSRLGEVLHSV